MKIIDHDKWHYKKYSRDPELAQLAFQARSKKVGLWKEPNSVPPWEWRTGKRQPSKKVTLEISGKVCTCIQKDR